MVRSYLKFLNEVASYPPSHFALVCFPFRVDFCFKGAFYILGEAIVNHLNRSRDMLSVMSVEDAMMGLWLLGVEKVMNIVLYSIH